MLSFFYHVKNLRTLRCWKKIQPLLNIAKVEAPNLRDIWLKSASVDTELIKWAYTNILSDLIVPLVSSGALRLQSAAYLTDIRENQQAAVFPTELSISGIDSPSCD